MLTKPKKTKKDTKKFHVFVFVFENGSSQTAPACLRSRSQMGTYVYLSYLSIFSHLLVNLSTKLDGIFYARFFQKSYLNFSF